MANKSIKTVNIIMPETMEYVVPMSTDKHRVNFIKQRCEKAVRSSMEYKAYINFLKETCDMKHCAFFQKITMGEGKKVHIEFHHEPFTLYDYCEVILDKFIAEGRQLNALLIADEVMELHYANKVGIIPLSKTIHEAYHNSDKITIPLNMVYGEYNQFLNEYDEYMSEDVSNRLYQKLEQKIQDTKNVTEETFDMLRKQFTYLDMKDVALPEKVQTNEVQIA